MTSRRNSFLVDAVATSLRNHSLRVPLVILPPTKIRNHIDPMAFLQTPPGSPVTEQRLMQKRRHSNTTTISPMKRKRVVSSGNMQTRRRPPPCAPVTPEQEHKQQEEEKGQQQTRLSVFLRLESIDRPAAGPEHEHEHDVDEEVGDPSNRDAILHMAMVEVASGSFCLECIYGAHLISASCYQFMMPLIDFVRVMERLFRKRVVFSQPPAHCDYIRLPFGLVYALNLRDANEFRDLLLLKGFQNIQFDGKTYFFACPDDHEIFDTLVFHRRRMVKVIDERRKLMAACFELHTQLRRMTIQVEQKTQELTTLEKKQASLVEENGPKITQDMLQTMEAVYERKENAGLLYRLMTGGSSGNSVGHCTA